MPQSPSSLYTAWRVSSRAPYAQWAHSHLSANGAFLLSQRVRFAEFVLRILIYSLRAKQAHTPSEDNSKGLAQYWQTTYAVGYLSVFADSVAILRSLLVNTTLGTSPTAAYPFSTSAAGPSDSNDSLLSRQGRYGLSMEEDQPRARFWYRRICGYLQLFTWIPVIMGTVQGLQYPKAETDSNTASLVMSLRYVAVPWTL